MNFGGSFGVKERFYFVLYKFKFIISIDDEYMVQSL